MLCRKCLKTFIDYCTLNNYIMIHNLGVDFSMCNVYTPKYRDVSRNADNISFLFMHLNLKMELAKMNTKSLSQNLLEEN